MKIFLSFQTFWSDWKLCVKTQRHHVVTLPRWKSMRFTYEYALHNATLRERLNCTLTSLRQYPTTSRCRSPLLCIRPSSFLGIQPPHLVQSTFHVDYFHTHSFHYTTLASAVISMMFNDLIKSLNMLNDMRKVWILQRQSRKNRWISLYF